MTKVESLEFIDLVLKGLWSNWQPKDEEVSLWVEKLQRFAYGASRAAVRNFKVTQQVAYRSPPFAKIMKCLWGANQKAVVKENAEPVLLYTLASGKDLEKRRTFYLNDRNKLPETPHEIEQEADRVQKVMNQMDDGNWIVIRDWAKLYGEEE